MIGAILKRETCKACKNCCWYTDDDVWDAPGLTKDELLRARNFVDTPVYESRKLFFFHMEKHEGKYICPLLSETGCLLGSEKPFKCAIWPVYVVHNGGRNAIAVSNECPTVYKLSNRELIERLGGVFPKIISRVKENPELIEPFREQFRIVCEIDTD